MAAEVTTESLLQSVNEAIAAVAIGGQSYKIGSRSLTRANLSELYAMRDKLSAEVAAKNSSGLFADTYVAEFMGR